MAWSPAPYQSRMLSIDYITKPSDGLMAGVLLSEYETQKAMAKMHVRYDTLWATWLVLQMTIGDCEGQRSYAGSQVLLPRHDQGRVPMAHQGG